MFHWFQNFVVKISLNLVTYVKLSSLLCVGDYFEYLIILLIDDIVLIVYILTMNSTKETVHFVSTFLNSTNFLIGRAKKHIQAVSLFFFYLIPSPITWSSSCGVCKIGASKRSIG